MNDFYTQSWHSLELARSHSMWESKQLHFLQVLRDTMGSDSSAAAGYSQHFAWVGR